MLLTRKELIQIMKLRPTVLQGWKADGLRVAGQIPGPGLPADQFESDDVLAFLENKCATIYKRQQKVYNERLLTFRAYLKKHNALPKKTKTVPDKKKISSGTPEKTGTNGKLEIDPDADIHEITEMLLRVREAEKDSHDKWLVASNDEDSPILTINLQKIWMEFIANRTKLEKQIPEILLAKKLYRPVDEIRQNCARIGTIFKNSLLGSGAKVRAQISTLVKSQEDAVLIENMITKINKEALHNAMTDLGKV